MKSLKQIMKKHYHNGKIRFAESVLNAVFEETFKPIVMEWIQQFQPQEPCDYNHMCKGEYEAYCDGKEAFYDLLMEDLENEG